MVAIILVGVVVHAAIPEIQQVGGDNTKCTRYQEPDLPGMEELFDHQQADPGCKKHERQCAMMMLPVSMKQGTAANEKCQHNHPGFEINIMDNIDTEQRQAAGYQR